MRPDLEFVLDCYKAHLGAPSGRKCEYLAAAGGLSGARFWRIVTEHGNFFLRRWPSEHPDRTRLTWIHATMAWIAAQGFSRIPLPLVNNQGATFVECQSYFWELSHRLEGEADFDRRPNDRKLRQAALTLAEFHQVTGDFAGNHRGPSRSLTYRWEVLERLAGGEFSAIVSGLDRVPQLWRREAQELVERFPSASRSLTPALRMCATSHYALQPCLRDIRRDHVFFVGDQVSGLVDFGSLDLDDPATDVARLFGSLAGDEPRFWRLAVEAYSEVARVDETFWERVATIDWTNVVLAGMNWLRWICIEDRRFDDRERVARHVCETLDRLVHRMDSGEGDPRGHGLDLDLR